MYDVKLSCKKSFSLYFEKAPLWMSDWVLNMPKYYLFAKYIESRKINQQSLFSVKLSDNSKALTVLYYHNRSIIQRDKPKNRATQVK